MPEIRCPICERYFDTADSAAMPFCSARCKQIDLGRWLGEKYSVPVEPSEEDDEGAPSQSRSPRGED